MPHSVSAKKRVRQTTRRNQRGRAMKSAIRSQTKKVIAAVEAGDPAAAAEGVRIAAKKLDKAARKGVIHRNTAARKKSRLSRMAAKVSSSGS